MLLSCCLVFVWATHHSTCGSDMTDQPEAGVTVSSALVSFSMVKSSAFEGLTGGMAQGPGQVSG